VLLAGLVTETTTVIEPVPTRDHTERMLLAAGAGVQRSGDAAVGFRTSVSHADELELETIDVPGDLSSAAFLIAAGVLVSGSRLVLEGVGVNWTRAGFLRILERMGAIVLGELEPVDGFGAHEPVADLDVSSAAIEATTVEPHEVPLAIDELPLVALLGCFAEGETVVRGAGELRIKESDRIATVVEGLRGLGGDIEATEDGFVVRGTGGLRGGQIDAHGDHRLALLGAVAGLAATAIPRARWLAMDDAQGQPDREEHEHRAEDVHAQFLRPPDVEARQAQKERGQRAEPRPLQPRADLVHGDDGEEAKYGGDETQRELGFPGGQPPDRHHPEIERGVHIGRRPARRFQERQARKRGGHSEPR